MILITFGFSYCFPKLKEVSKGTSILMEGNREFRAPSVSMEKHREIV